MNMNSTLQQLIKLAMVICVFAFVTSCKDDDKEEPVSIVGTWNAITEGEADCPNSVDSWSETYSCPDHCYSLVLKDDGTWIATRTEAGQVDDTFLGDYTVSGETFSLCSSSTTSCDEFTFTLSATELVLTGPDGDCTYTVIFERG